MQSLHMNGISKTEDVPSEIDNAKIGINEIREQN